MRRIIEIEAHDILDLESHLGATYGPVIVRPPGLAAGPVVTATLVQMDGLAIEWSQIDGSLEFEPQAEIGASIFHIVEAGHLGVTLDGRYEEVFPGSMIALYNPQIVRIESGTVQTVVAVADSLLQKRVSTLLDRPVERLVRFATRPQPQLPQVAVLASNLSQMRHSPLLGIAELMGSRHESLVHMIADSLLLGFPNNFTEAFATPVPQVAPRHVKRAIDYIHSRPNRHIPPEVLAALSSVSVRSLQYSFQAVTGHTISDYQRLLRLRQAYDMVAARRDMTLTAIAEAWGFKSLAAFGQSFKKAYGVTPSEIRRNS